MYLYKKGIVRKNWKKRWFVISKREGKVSYYEKEGNKNLKGEFYLHAQTVLRYDLEDVKINWEVMSKGIVVDLGDASRTYYLRGSTADVERFFGMLEETVKQLDATV